MPVVPPRRRRELREPGHHRDDDGRRLRGNHAGRSSRPCACRTISMRPRPRRCCARATTFNALRNAGARAGDVVAVHGLGGRPSRGAVREQDGVSYRRDRPRSRQGRACRAARRASLHRCADRGRRRRAARARRAKVVLGTAPTGSGMADTVAGLSARGKLIVVAVPGEPIAVNAVDLVFGGRSVVGALTERWRITKRRSRSRGCRTCGR